MWERGGGQAARGGLFILMITDLQLIVSGPMSVIPSFSVTRATSGRPCVSHRGIDITRKNEMFLSHLLLVSYPPGKLGWDMG